MEESKLEIRRNELKEIDKKVKCKIEELLKKYALSGILREFDGFYFPMFSVLNFGPLDKDRLADIASKLGNPPEYESFVKETIEACIKEFDVKFVGRVMVDDVCGPDKQSSIGIFATDYITQEKCGEIREDLQEIVNWYYQLLDSRYGSDLDSV